MGKRIELKSGTIFGKLTVLNEVEPHIYPSGVINRKFLFKCECGNKKEILMNSVLRGSTVSCGCFQDESKRKAKNNLKHGLCNTSEYRTYNNMVQRCYNQNRMDYENYGGRGITVCDRWLESFDNFFNDMGKKPTEKHSIDRINVNGNYEPSNCRWATSYEQRHNRRDTCN